MSDERWERALRIFILFLWSTLCKHKFSIKSVDSEGLLGGEQVYISSFLKNRRETVVCINIRGYLFEDAVSSQEAEDAG